MTHRLSLVRGSPPPADTPGSAAERFQRSVLRTALPIHRHGDVVLQVARAESLPLYPTPGRGRNHEPGLECARGGRYPPVGRKNSLHPEWGAINADRRLSSKRCRRTFLAPLPGCTCYWARNRGCRPP